MKFIEDVYRSNILFEDYPVGLEDYINEDMLERAEGYVKDISVEVYLGREDKYEVEFFFLIREDFGSYSFDRIETMFEKAIRNYNVYVYRFYYW